MSGAVRTAESYIFRDKPKENFVVRNLKLSTNLFMALNLQKIEAVLILVWFV